ncbi:hypothetical protein JOC77_003614 [Peribacillus deserti]|uniref:Uncharacterized protein n=1 Tax=Peribacillus deserti TaxID=673318 RepID=A0ABS2QMD0_9BACI|nr:hypothetical protein [Peribacillus deserti]MBM7694170.1 hypothetical protein [Peribacillus deserti]
MNMKRITIDEEDLKAAFRIIRNEVYLDERGVPLADGFGRLNGQCER